MGSVTTSYGTVADTLKTAEWFDVKQFPQGIFKANHFVKVGDKEYQAEGMLTLRDKTLPLTVNFVLENYSDTAASVKGSLTLKRTAFRVGQGDWAATDVIKDDVQVNFTVKAIKK